MQWFNDNHTGLLVGFAIMFIIAGMASPANALIAYSMRRMSVSPAFGYAYLVMYALSAVPGMLLMCIALSVGAMRPDRDPELIAWIYDFAFLSFIGTMGDVPARLAGVDDGHPASTRTACSRSGSAT